MARRRRHGWFPRPDVLDVRRALGDRGQQIVRTVPRRGYIFEAAVRSRTKSGLEQPPILQTGRAATLPGGRIAIRSLAVLPLLNLAGDPAQEHFADGMTEALISHLARLQGLNVISRTSAMRFKGSHKSLPEIGSELHVDVAIEGAVQRAGGRVRVTVQLIDAQTDAHLWSRHYDRELTNILDLETEIARAVAEEIRGQLTPQEGARLASHAPIDPDAHEAYLLGRSHLSFPVHLLKVDRVAVRMVEKGSRREPFYISPRPSRLLNPHQPLVGEGTAS